MAELDYGYIANLVEQTKRGSTRAFAELYACTYQKQYMLASVFLNDDNLAKTALQEIYIRALKNISQLSDSRLFVSWLNQINLRICFQLAGRQESRCDTSGSVSSSRSESPAVHQITVDGKEYGMPQILALPYSESQAVILRCSKGLRIRQIAAIMEIRPGAVRQYLRRGKQRLAGLLPERRSSNAQK